MHLHTRYALMRADGRWFKHPSDLDPTEWTAHLQDAHLWVDLDACKAAAYLHRQLRCEDVLPIELVVSQSGQRFQANSQQPGTLIKRPLAAPQPPTAT